MFTLVGEIPCYRNDKKKKKKKKKNDTTTTTTTTTATNNNNNNTTTTPSPPIQPHTTHTHPAPLKVAMVCLKTAGVKSKKEEEQQQ